MKKLCFLFIALSWSFLGVACNTLNDDYYKQSASSNLEPNISYEEKYICGLDIEKSPAKQKYYIIHEDGTAEYHYYDSHYDALQINDYAVSSYTMYLKYELDEEESSIYCFYDGDGIIYDEADNKKEKNPVFYVKLTYDKDFLTEEQGTTYVSQTYLIENPEFGK